MLKHNDLAGHTLEAQLSHRPELARDEAFMSALYASTRAEELALVPWSAEAKAAFVDSQFKAMRHGYATQFPDGEFLIILLGPQPIGRLVIHRSTTELRLVDISILPEFRGRGIGSFYLTRLAGEARLADLPFRLHVFKGSRPWHLYQRLGFQKIGEDGPYEHLELPAGLRPS